MARFLNRPLGWLDQVFDFSGNDVRTNTVDLSAVQLVHDVAPGAVQEESRRLTNRLRAALSNGGEAPENVVTLTDEENVNSGSANVITFPIWQFVDSFDLENQVDVWLVDFRLSCVGPANSTLDGYVGVIRRSANDVANRGITRVLFTDCVKVLNNGKITALDEVPIQMTARVPLPYQIRRPARNGAQTEDDLLGAYIRNTGAGNDTVYGQADFICTPRGIYPSWI
jgi:hypothetical protein